MIRRKLRQYFDTLILNIVASATPLVLEYYNKVYSRKWHPHDAMRDEALAETIAYIKAEMADAVIGAASRVRRSAIGQAAEVAGDDEVTCAVASATAEASA